ncbi:tetratricopeptide repeat protein [uncultured Brevundimonas sp.]|uniref:tetratricopeptide repeat protein n=1 Tax=uncultured Brevundimonas sp. TaxID=213418 RepID=UPI0030EBDCDB|tara:strand:+ start:31767 stop:33569 length:1803 start_codon:yes stop_codon:yes gene_type:complete
MSAPPIMPAVEHSPPTLDSLVGDAASPEAISRLTRASRPPLRSNPKRAGKSATQASSLAMLRSALKAIGDGDYAEGTRLTLKALEKDEKNGLAWHILAVAQEKTGNLAEAFSAYEAAVRLLDDDTSVAFDLGRLAHRLGYLEIAEKLLSRFLSRNPGNVEASNNLACALRDQNRSDEAIDVLRNLIAVCPEEAVLWNSLGTVLSERGDAAQSVPFYDEALRLDAGFYKARYNRANVRMQLGEPALALADIDTALVGVKDANEVATMTMAKALTQFMVGDLRNGFDSYEARFDPALQDAVTFQPHGRRWTLEDDIEGRAVLIYGEQGLGDEVLFANVLDDVQAAIGPKGRMILAVQARLVPLFQRSYPSADVVKHQTGLHLGRLFRAVELPTATPEVDLWTPIGSLFRRFRTSADSFPDKRAFLTPDPERVAHWHRMLSGLGPGLKVGVLWKSLNMKGARLRAYSPFDLWRPVLSVPGAHYVNLQYGDATAELEAARAAGLEIWTPPGIDLKDDLDDLAALCTALDIVMGPSTATTNIAAACGARVMMISNPDAWTGFGTDRAPCYPSLQAFHADGMGEWTGVMARLAEALSGEVAREHVG